jgi:hypothetical protein
MNEWLSLRSLPALMQIIGAETRWSEDSYHGVRAGFDFQVTNPIRCRTNLIS